MTVARTSQVGITSFGVVHDNFATVAGDYDVLALQTRESFHLVHRGQLVEPESEEAAEQELDEREAEQVAFMREWDEHGELSADSRQRIQDRVTAKRRRARELPLNALYRQLQAQIEPDELPSKPPALGSLDLDLVLQSPYFFA
jgi:DNA-directed RNA polymerase